jgi:hypothetical protein
MASFGHSAGGGSPDSDEPLEAAATTTAIGFSQIRRRSFPRALNPISRMIDHGKKSRPPASLIPSRLVLTGRQSSTIGAFSTLKAKSSAKASSPTLIKRSAPSSVTASASSPLRGVYMSPANPETMPSAGSCAISTASISMSFTRGLSPATVKRAAIARPKTTAAMPFCLAITCDATWMSLRSWAKVRNVSWR